MEPAQGTVRDIMAGTQGDWVARVYRRVIAYGAASGGVLHGSNCRIAAIVRQHLMKSMRGLAARVEKVFTYAR